MWTRNLVLTAVMTTCLFATACKKLPPQTGEEISAELDASKMATTIPLEYGDLVGATINSPNTRWVTLYFQKPDKTIVVLGLDRKTWKVWKEPHVYPRD